MEVAFQIEPEDQTELETRALSVPEQARAIKIKDVESYKKAAELLLQIKDLRKEIDDAYDDIIKAAHDAHKKAITKKKKYEEPLAEAERIIKPSIAAYQAEQERKRREEEARLAEEARKKEEDERLAKAIEAEDEGMSDVAEEILEEPAYVPPPVVPVATPKVSGISTRTVYKFRIIKPELIPNQYKVIDEKAIAAVVRTLGYRSNIPGIEVFTEQVVAAGRR